jgi:death-on-curing protein
VIFAIHDRQIAEHGGGHGVRDVGLLESGLARPRNLAAYETPDAATLAAAYLYGHVRNHPFIDGNKRTGWTAARLFLADNGFGLTFERTEAVRLVEAVAAGAASEAEVAAWFRDHIQRATASAANRLGGPSRS